MLSRISFQASLAEIKEMSTKSYDPGDENLRAFPWIEKLGISEGYLFKIFPLQVQ